MAFWRGASAGRGVDRDRRFGIKRLEQQRVADYADIRAEPNKIDLLWLVAFQHLVDAHRQTHAAEGVLRDHVLLVRNVFVHQRHPDGGVWRPAVGARDAVLDGQLLPLFRVEVVLRVRVQRVENQSVKVENALHDGFHHRLRFF